MEQEIKMKKSSCLKNTDAVYLPNRAAYAIAVALGMAPCVLVFRANASPISLSTLRSAESANTAQRKSGSHSQPQQVPQSADPNSTQKGANMIQAKGTFEVKLDPQGDADKAEGSTLARMSIDKKYHGDLEGTAQGTMLTAGTDVKGSAGYVAVERVTGTLNGKSGSFVLQHSGTLTRGAAVQNISVVPDSGTGQLAGIAGKFVVIIAEGKHSYEFDYTLPAQ
jgi:hypothetical protein